MLEIPEAPKRHGGLLSLFGGYWEVIWGAIGAYWQLGVSGFGKLNLDG